MIKEYFEKNCINMRAYARKNGLEQSALSRVVNGKLKGLRNTNGDTRKVFETLYKDGIIKELPKALQDEKSA